MFRPISVRLDRDAQARLRRLATRCGMTQSAVVREALAAYEPDDRQHTATSAYDRLAPWIGCARRATLATRFDARVGTWWLGSERRPVPAAVLVDAGPLVAIVDSTDPFHRASVDALRSIRQQLVTVWPCVVEAVYLLDGSARGQEAVLEMIEEQQVGLARLDQADVTRIRDLMRKYRDFPMDLADAALVRVAERDGVSRVFTLDRRHFTAYRIGGRRPFSIVPLGPART